MFANGFLHIDTLVLVDQQKLTFIYSELTLNISKRIYEEQSTVEMYRKKESKEFLLSACLDDEDNKTKKEKDYSEVF